MQNASSHCQAQNWKKRKTFYKSKSSIWTIFQLRANIRSLSPRDLRLQICCVSATQRSVRLLGSTVTEQSHIYPDTVVLPGKARACDVSGLAISNDPDIDRSSGTSLCSIYDVDYSPVKQRRRKAAKKDWVASA